ncbi:hypothetical protein ANCCAN_24671, partial [Ancylostoma caninum]
MSDKHELSPLASEQMPIFGERSPQPIVLADTGNLGYLLSSLIFFHLTISMSSSDFDALSKCCNSTSPQAYCDFVSYITLDVAGNAWPKVNDNSIAGQCGNLVVQQGFNDVWGTANDVYNTFQDCYSTAPDGSRSRRKRSVDMPPLMNTKPFADQAKTINYQSTDANGGFACFNGDATEAYLNLASVRKAIHIPDNFTHWSDCNDDMNANYIQQHNDTSSVFVDILNS